VIECRSKRLDLETIDFDSSWDDDEEEPKIPNGDGTLDVIRELRARSSPLAAILESTHASMSQVRSARVAISSAFHAGADPEARDLVLYAAHLWAAKFADSLNGSGQGREPPPADTAVTNEFNQSFSPHGVKLLYDEHWSYWCYNGQFIRSLVGRPHANRWTGYAFLDRMREGWIAPCTGCGSGSVVETDESGPVISRGEAFLKARPDTWNAPEIRLMLAEAHETAWSLSIMYPVEENPAWTGYLDAPAHRKQAIALYEGQLRTRPQDPRNVAIRLRLARLRIDVDTSYHKYWCFDD
jgi:hypothetical protein